MKREDVAKRIAEDLLNDNVLDEQNFNYDTDAILQHVQDTVLSHLSRNFLSLGITLLFHIHKGIIGCRQALDFLAFRYFFGIIPIRYYIRR